MKPFCELTLHKVDGLAGKWYSITYCKVQSGIYGRERSARLDKGIYKGINTGIYAGNYTGIYIERTVGTYVTFRKAQN